MSRSSNKFSNRLLNSIDNNIVQPSQDLAERVSDRDSDNSDSEQIQPPVLTEPTNQPVQQAQAEEIPSQAAQAAQQPNPSPVQIIQPSRAAVVTSKISLTTTGIPSTPTTPVIPNTGGQQQKPFDVLSVVVPLVTISLLVAVGLFVCFLVRRRQKQMRNNKLFPQDYSLKPELPPKDMLLHGPRQPQFSQQSFKVIERSEHTNRSQKHAATQNWVATQVPIVQEFSSNPELLYQSSLTRSPSFQRKQLIDKYVDMASAMSDSDDELYTLPNLAYNTTPEQDIATLQL